MSEEKSVFGLSPNIAAALSYVLGFITGIVFFSMENNNKFVRFHAMQSILLSVSFIILSIIIGFIPGIRWLLYAVLQIAGLICWLMAIIKASQCEHFKLPLIGDWAEKQV